MTSRLNDLKSQHIATEVKAIDDKTKKNSSDILGLEGRLKQKEDTINENERGLSFNRGFSIIFKKVILYMNVNLVCLTLLIKKYLNRNQQVLLIMLMILI